MEKAKKIEFSKEELATEQDLLHEKISIKDCKDKDITLRRQQEDYADDVYENYNDFNVHVGTMPVATGKSRCVTMLANWLEKTLKSSVAIITNTKMLQDQYEADFPWITLLKGSNAYPCRKNPGKDCGIVKSVVKKYCNSTNDGHSCTYLTQRQLAEESHSVIFNFHSYFFNDMYRKVMVVDEAHNAANFISGLFGDVLWQFKEGFPDFQPTGRFRNGFEVNKKEVSEWLHEYAQELRSEMNAANTRQDQSDKFIDAMDKKIKKMEALSGALSGYPEDMLVLIKEEPYFGHEREFEHLKGTDQKCLFLKPLKVDKMASKILWPKEKVDKIFLLSSTIGEQDIKQLGLDKRNVRYFECGSPIPPEKRPFIYWPVVNMSWKERDNSTEALVKAILKISKKFPDKKGMIHCTYKVAEKLKSTKAFGNRFMFHGKRDKNDVYYRFRESKEPLIMIASGMSEGVDLAGKDYGFQVITMVTRPSIADDVNFWNVRNNIDQYDWETVRTIIQQTGRICRDPEDEGITFMIDSQFGPLFEKTHNKRINRGKKSMWYKWFVDAVKF